MLGQDPSPGAGAEDGEAVTLELASGSVRLRPAGLVGDGYVEAAREVVELGLVPRRGEVARAEGAGTVVDVGAAGRLTLGSLVTLTVAVAPEPAPAPAVPRRAPVAPVVAAPATSPRPGSDAPSAGRATARAPEHHAPKTDGKKHDHEKAAKPGKSGKAHGKKK